MDQVGASWRNVGARHLPAVLLAMNGVMHLYFGGLFIAAPQAIMADLSIAALTPAGLTEMRTFYGGLMTAIGVYFCWGAGSKKLRYGALVFLIVSYAGAVAARSFGMAVDGVSDPIIVRILVIEVAGLASGCLGLWVHSRRASA